MRFDTMSTSLSVICRVGGVLTVFLIGCSLAVAADYDYNVGAYYYPWYGNDNFHGGADTTLRDHLIPKQQPTLGWYDQRAPSVISQHYDWARYAGVDYFVCSYWGEGLQEDLLMRNYMFDNPDRGNIKLATFLEPLIGADTVYDEIAHQAQNYFNQEGYYKVDGKPVVYVYKTALKDDAYIQNYANLMRQAAADNGYPEIYIVADEMYGALPGNSPSRLAGYFDAITGYDFYAQLVEGFGNPTTTAALDLWDSCNDSWQAACEAAGLDFIPGITPGFNNRGTGGINSPMPRILAGSSEFGSVFEAELLRVLDNTDEDLGRALMVTSWNEWHEDTQIKPVMGGATTNVDDSDGGNAYTQGVYYESYGTRYLDILREHTYMPIPEPPAFALLATGFISIGALTIIRRKRHSARR